MCTQEEGCGLWRSAEDVEQYISASCPIDQPPYLVSLFPSPGVVGSVLRIPVLILKGCRETLQLWQEWQFPANVLKLLSFFGDGIFRSMNRRHSLRFSPNDEPARRCGYVGISHARKRNTALKTIDYQSQREAYSEILWAWHALCLNALQERGVWNEKIYFDCGLFLVVQFPLIE